MGLLRSCSPLSAIAVIVAAGLVVAACGGGSSSGGTSSSSTAASNGISGSTPGSAAGTGGMSSSTSATSTYSSGQATVIGKSTDVRVNRAVSAALRHAGIVVTAVAPATARRTLHFPVSGGQIVVSTLAGTVDHIGGLAFRRSSKSVMVTNFVINTSTKQLTATVGGHSMPIFDLNLSLPKSARGPHGPVIASKIKLTVTSRAATALNSRLGASTFKAGINFGIAELTVAYARGHR
jgi:hypothetical protein